MSNKIEKKTKRTIHQQGDRWWFELHQKDEGQTYASLVKEYSPEPLSWKKARQIIHSGKAFLDGARLVDPAKRYQGGKQLEVSMSAPKRAKSGDLDSERIIYVDRHIVVVNKPSGIPTVPFHDEEVDTLYLLLKGTLQRIRKGKVQDPLFIVHRLDKLTSGLVIFARSKKAMLTLQKQFADHSIVREYYAVVSGVPTETTIVSWLVEDRGDNYRGSLPEEEALQHGGRKAITHLKVLEKYKEASLISCTLETGRTHQIRIQLSEAGHPLVGDSVYLKACSQKGREFLNIPSFSRVALHAKKLTFIHPITSKKISLSTELPKSMKKLIKELKMDLDKQAKNQKI